MDDKKWTASDVFRITGAYWAGCALQTGVQLELFTALHNGPKHISDLTAELGCNARALSMLVTALTAMDLLERDGEHVRAPKDVLSLLSHDSPDYVGFIVKHHANIMPAWVKLAQAVCTGNSTAERSTLHTPDAAEREDFLMGMFNIARLQADRIAEALDLNGRERLIDIGGGPGTYAISFCKKNPRLTATVFDLPTTEPFARKTISRFGLESRIGFTAGDFSADELPKGQDVAWLSQVLHGESPSGAAALVKSAGRCLKPGGLLCVQEFALDDDGTGPRHAALFSLNMLVQTPSGQAYSKGEISAMFKEAGAVSVRELDIELPQNCRVLIGSMP